MDQFWIDSTEFFFLRGRVGMKLIVWEGNELAASILLLFAPFNPF